MTAKLLQPQSFPPKGSALVQLGRIGDLLSILPILKHIGGGYIVTRPEFMGVLDSVSYAKGIEFRGNVCDYHGAVKVARRKGTAVYVTQCFGDADAARQTCDDFAHEEWARAGVDPSNGFGTLDIDIRFREDEQALICQHRKTDKPLILVNTLGLSTPYPYREALAEHLRNWEGRAEILDLSEVHAVHFCDLLGLYDIATALITIDTATLHLASASKVPVIYLRPQGWIGSPPKGKCCHVQYQHDLDFSKIGATIEYLLTEKPLTVWYAIPTVKPEECGETFAKWKAMGYKTAALVDGATLDPQNADLIIRTDAYPGYGAAVNRLARAAVEHGADIVVTGGDDISPDPRYSVSEIAADFGRHFRGTLGVMQPYREADPVTGGEAGSAVSPWLGKEWILRAYQGKGPLNEAYHHYFTDTELRDVAIHHGLYWENHGVEQFHDIWSRGLSQNMQEFRRNHPSYLNHAFEKQSDDYRLCVERRAAKWPGSEIIGYAVPRTVSAPPVKIVLSGRVFWLHCGNLYPDYLNEGNAQQFIAHRADEYCIGKGIDVGANQWPYRNAIPIRDEEHANAYKLDQFEDGELDFVFNSHVWEHLSEPAKALALWVRKLKPDGVVFLYAPHPSMTLWQPGAPWCGNGHVWSPSFESTKRLFEAAGLYVCDGDAGPDVYQSFWLVGRKL